MTILDDIIDHKRSEIRRLRSECAIEMLAERCRSMPPTRAFSDALTNGSTVAVIAEIKRHSPSRGPLRPLDDPLNLARQYEHAGAAAVSVLTDNRFFGGSISDLKHVHSAVSIPVLRKEFILDELQLLESRVCGADAVLLIVTALEDSTLGRLLTRCQELGMAALVEVHTIVEAQRAVAAGARIVGINNRDLRSFQTDLATTRKVRDVLPPETVCIAESGIHNTRDVEFVASAGVDAILVGESIITAPNPRTKIDSLRGVPRHVC